MASNNALILAAIAAAGTTGTELLWVAPVGTTLPTDATTALPAAWKSAGFISQDGIEKSIKTSSSDVKAFGTLSPVRKIVTDEEVTFKISMLEHNAISLALYNKLPLSGAGALTITSGAFSIADGKPRVQRYSVVADLVDGANRVRAVIEQFEVTERESQAYKAGEAIALGITATAYPGATGDSVITYYNIPALV